MNKVPKVGIFGWTGTGKTTYISMLQYLLSSSKHPYVIASHIDNDKEIENNIESFLLSDSWEEIATKIDGSLHTTNLTFTLHTSDVPKKFEIQDYKGESISRQNDGSEEEVHKYFLGCDALLLFLDAEAFEESNEVENRKRWNEFQIILHKLLKENGFQSTSIPIYLVITKKDILEFQDDGSSNLKEGEVTKRYQELMEVVESYSDRTTVYYISTKDCFEYYVKGKGTDSSLSESFCGPVMRSLKEIEILERNKRREKDKLNKIKKKRESDEILERKIVEKKKRLNKILKISLPSIMVVILLYSMAYYKYDNDISSLLTIDEVRRYKDANSFSFFPSLDDKLNMILSEKSLNLTNMLKKNDISEEERLALINDFTTLFPNQSSRSYIDNDSLIKISDIERSAKIINKITKSDRSEYRSIDILCKEYYSLNNKYFRDTVSSICKIAIDDKLQNDKQVEIDQLESRNYDQRQRANNAQIEAERISRELYEEKNKSAWDKFWE